MMAASLLYPSPTCIRPYAQASGTFGILHRNTVRIYVKGIHGQYNHLGTHNDK